MERESLSGVGSGDNERGWSGIVSRANSQVVGLHREQRNIAGRGSTDKKKLCSPNWCVARLVWCRSAK